MYALQTEYGYVANVFLVLFILIAQFIFLNVFIAVIYENFSESKPDTNTNNITLRKSELKDFIKTWAHFVPDGGYFM